jgi:hypothetical protein
MRIKIAQLSNKQHLSILPHSWLEGCFLNFLDEFTWVRDNYACKNVSGIKLFTDLQTVERFIFALPGYVQHHVMMLVRAAYLYICLIVSLKFCHVATGV